MTAFPRFVSLSGFRNAFFPAFALASLNFSVFAEHQPLDRYTSIIDRQMFGELPQNFDPTKMPSEVAKINGRSAEKELTKEQEQIKKAIKYTVLNVNPDGQAVVGFSDYADAKNPVHYYMKVGETRNGWTVKAVDPKTTEMTVVSKDGIEVTLQLGGDAKTAPAAASVANVPPHGGRSLLGGALSLRQRRQQREAEVQADQVRREKEAKEREAKEEEDRAQRAAEREEQRKQLLSIQEELRKVRETKEAEKEQKEGGEAGSD